MMQLRAWTQLAVSVVPLLTAVTAHGATGQQSFAACIACHGARAEGNPAIGAQYGRQMAMMSTRLASDRELDDLIGYILATGATR